MTLKTFIKKYPAEIIGSIGCLSLGLLVGAWTSAGDSTWYATLMKPSFTPPNWVFGPVWSLLYIMMGVALGKIWRSENKLLLNLFILQFALNLAWSPLFFYFQRIDLALYSVCLLWGTLIIFLAGAWKNRLIFVLFVPYVLWVSFALILNGSLYQLNSLPASLS